jgi:hypothetical protein
MRTGRDVAVVSEKVDPMIVREVKSAQLILDRQVTHDIDKRLEKRLGRPHARLRLGIEADHEAQVFGQGINYFHIENLSLSRVAFMPEACGSLWTRAKERRSDRTEATRRNVVACPKGI